MISHGMHLISREYFQRFSFILLKLVFQFVYRGLWTVASKRYHGPLLSGRDFSVVAIFEEI